MKHSILIVFLIQTVFAIKVFGQEIKVNLVIQWNDKLVRQEISNVRLYIETTEKTHNLDAGYNTGDLLLPANVSKILTRDSIKSMTLMFDLNSFRRDKHEILNVKTSFSKFLMGQPYLILNVYDFSDKKYKRRFGYLTKDKFICEYEFPNSGRYIRQR
jgi:hypothetical protein